MNQSTDTDSYIKSFPQEVQQQLEQLRATIKKAAPKAMEAISYGMPTFKQNGNLVHFAAYKKHIGFYPAPTGIAAFEEELAPYERSKGAIRFPIDQPLPLKLIAKMVKLRVEQNEAKAAEKTAVKQPPVEKKDFMNSISVPAKRALENKGIRTLKQLAQYSEADILALHGIGPGSMPKLRSGLEEAGLKFRK